MDDFWAEIVCVSLWPCGSEMSWERHSYPKNICGNWKCQQETPGEVEADQ